MRVVHRLPVTALILALAPGCSRQGYNPVGNSPTPSTAQPDASQRAALKATDGWKRPAQIQENISVERCHAGGNSKQEYFLMRHRKPARPVDKYGLVVIVPGGPGTAEFLPFGANVLTGVAIPDDFLVAQLVAFQWRPGDDRIVWPSHVFPEDQAEFTTEAFLAAVIDEVSKKQAIDERFVVTLEGRDLVAQGSECGSIEPEMSEGNRQAAKQFLGGQAAGQSWGVSGGGGPKPQGGGAQQATPSGALQPGSIRRAQVSPASALPCWQRPIDPSWLCCTESDAR